MAVYNLATTDSNGEPTMSIELHGNVDPVLFAELLWNLIERAADDLGGSAFGGVSLRRIDNDQKTAD